MTDSIVRTHTNQSNRAKAKDALERKTIFRSVLDNPFRIQWPGVPVNVQNSILAKFVDILQGVREYRGEYEKQMSKKRKATRPQIFSPPSKRRKVSCRSRSGDNINADTGFTKTVEIESGAKDGDGNDAVKPRPDVLDHLTAGINEVTKLLEKTVCPVPRATLGTCVHETTLKARPAIILVCRGDVTPPELIQHIPHLVAASNARNVGTDVPVVHLIPLPKGAESSLAEVIGLRRVSVVALHAGAPRLSELTSLLANIPPPAASWLATPTRADWSLIPTHIKQMKTTAPKDMRVAKEQRSRGRAHAKAKKRAKLQQEIQEQASQNPQP